MDYKIFLGGLAIIVGLVGYAPYLRDLFKRKTRPHAFSWFAWGVLETTAFFAQISKGAGWGALITAFSAVVALFVAGVAFKRKDTEIKKVDWVALGGALIGIILWRLTHNPLLAVIFVTIADALAFIPTFRKSYHHPHQETLIEYALSAIKWSIALFALQSFNLTTWLYPASLIITNSSFTLMSWYRRRKIAV